MRALPIFLSALVLTCTPESPQNVNQTAKPSAMSTSITPPAAAPQAAPDLRETPDVSNRIFAAQISKAKVISFSATDIPKDAFSNAPFERVKSEKPPQSAPPDKIHPLLRKWLSGRAPNEVATIVVNFADNLRIPRFPEPVTNEPRGSDKNKRALGRATEIVSSIQAKRAEDYKQLVSRLGQLKGEVVEQFWLVRALRVKIPLSSVAALAEQRDVLYVEPDQTEDKPPQNANPNDDVIVGRGEINSDPYFNVPLSGGFIGLLDTGVRQTHVMFNGPSHLGFRFDCVNGGATCSGGAGFNPNDDCWDHGTSSAAIIMGNSRQGARFRGVTEVTTDSLKVYPSTFSGTNCTGSLNTTAVVRGFQEAVAILDRVIVAEMQGTGNQFSTISVAANNAFDAGAVIIAANGNNGPGAGTVNTPANAQRVIGIGNFDVQTLGAVASQSRGPTPDNRIKPDVQTPTNSETGSNGCPFGQTCTQSDTGFQVFGGTSGATPYGGGGAALLRNFLRGASFSIDPGQVYAQIILSGQTSFPFDNTSGAGRLRLPTDGWAWWGRVDVNNGQTIDIPIGLTVNGQNRLDAALWWPESATHNDVDLFIINPGGGIAASSVSSPSVFERARVTAPTSGTWKIRIRGFSVPAGPQSVYWAVALHTQ